MPKQRPGRPIAFSNVDKVYFPKGRYTKGEMLQYYIAAAPFIVPHLRDRPVTLIRFPDDVRGKSFYEKNAPGFTPAWIKRAPVPRREDAGTINYLLVNDAETLAWCANLGAIEFHPFLHRADRLSEPTQIAFDLDPGEGADLLTCAEVAFLLRDVLSRLGLQAFPKVSGSKGLQLYVPLNSGATYAATQPFAKTVAALLAKEHPKLVVSEMSKLLRKGRVMIDWSQNSESKTTVCVYSMRAKRDEPFISAPVTWREIEQAHAQRAAETLFFPPDEALRRMKKLGDLFAPVLELEQQLPEAFLQLPPKTRRSSLSRYAAKRDFTRTSEPAPAPLPRRSRQGSTRRFVIQKHAATRLHYDFRLEMEDTLKSWAVPKGPPYEPGVKRAAIEVEDHPLDYLDFEGTIPKGQYGGGTVMVWDIGTYDLIGGDLRRGDLKLWLNGRKLTGEWHLFRIKTDDAKPVWLLQRSAPAMKPVSAKQDDTSALSGRTMEQIANAAAAASSGAGPDLKTRDPRGGRAKRAADDSPDVQPAKPQTGPTGASVLHARRTRSRGAQPRFVEPMAAQPATELPEGPEWLYEVKWDGFRALGIKDGDDVQLLSRNHKSLAREFPTIVSQLSAVAAERAVIDGEIVAIAEDGRPSFQALQNRGTSNARIVFYAFDLLHLDGADLLDRPLTERKAQLARLTPGSGLALSGELPGSASEVVAAVRKLGLEGVIAKRRDSAYEPGERNHLWKKLRLNSEQEFVIGGFQPGMKPFESILVGYYEGKQLLFASKVRPGFSPRTRQLVWEQIKADVTSKCPFANLPDADRKGRWGEGITAEDMKGLRWVKPRVVVQIAFVEWTSHGHLRHAAFKGLRTDKAPRDVVRESS